MLHGDCSQTHPGLGSDLFASNYQELQCLNVQKLPSPYKTVGISEDRPSSQSLSQLYHPSLEWLNGTSLETKEYQWSSNYPATEMFRRCSQALTNPFSRGFVIDPTKLNSSSLLLSGLDVEQQRHGTGQVRIKIVDVGGRVSGKDNKTPTIPIQH
jgi:hypothetical protein